MSSENKANNLSHVYLAGGIACWVILVVISFYGIQDLKESFFNIPAHIQVLKNTALSFHFLFVFLYFKLNTRKLPSLNFNEWIWRGFAVGAFMFSGMIAIKLISSYTHGSQLETSPLFLNITYHINIVFISVFLGNNFYVFKKMILYQRSKQLQKYWNVYEILVYLCLVIILLQIDFFDPITLTLLAGMGLFSLYLSTNLKWVAYLNFKQKWRSILLVLLNLLIAISFIEYIFSHTNLLGLPSNQLLANDLGIIVFTYVVFIFIIFYCLSSVLVLLFNLPTSSVFEQKLEEVFNYQRLSQSMPMAENETQVYDLLIETSLNTSLADAAWLEIVNSEGEHIAFLEKNIDKLDVFEIKKLLKRNQLKSNLDKVYVRNLARLEHIDGLAISGRKSVLLIPLISNFKYIGSLGLLKNIPDGFDKEVQNIISTFVNQATISITNARLMNEALEHERYKEEINIAKKVQKSLLPAELVYDSAFRISAISKAADEVGGDYYDTFRISPTQIAIVIADVSGHGTSAAFNMAKLKGVFHSLIQLNLSTSDFVYHANQALGQCLDKKTFVTLALFVIDTSNNTFTCSRAGHCPTLFYKNETKSIEFLEEKGLGLGILRDKNYKTHVTEVTYSYSSGDLLLMYTDGIVEAKNKVGEEFGYNSLSNALLKHIHVDTQMLVESIIGDVYAFSESIDLEDDHTCLAIKFV